MPFTKQNIVTKLSVHPMRMAVKWRCQKCGAKIGIKAREIKIPPKGTIHGKEKDKES